MFEISGENFSHERVTPDHTTTIENCLDDQYSIGKTGSQSKFYFCKFNWGAGGNAVFDPINCLS